MDVVNTPDGATEHPGGSPLNIAFGLARLGDSVNLVTALGGDRRGQAITEHLESAGVHIEPSSIRAEPTSTSLAALDTSGRATYSFDIRWSLPDGWRLPPAEIVHTGSLGAFVEPGGSSVVKLLQDLGPDTVITFDPNIRPSICGSHEQGLARFLEIARTSTVVKLSDEDASWLYPDLDDDQILQRILSLGPALVAITRGEHGATLVTTSCRAHVPGRRVKVADTIGAGDSFMSALISSVADLLAQGIPPAQIQNGTVFTAALLRQMGQFAVECAAITVSRAGAKPPTRAELSAEVSQ